MGTTKIQVMSKAKKLILDDVSNSLKIGDSVQILDNENMYGEQANEIMTITHLKAYGTRQGYRLDNRMNELYLVEDFK